MGRLNQSILLCIVSAIARLIVDRTAGHNYSRVFIPFWNTGIRLGFFIVTARLLARVRSQLEKERRMARLDGLIGQFQLTLALTPLGHAEGDRVIRTGASILSKSVRSADLIGRLGGDEFAILLPEITCSGAATMFENLCEGLLKEAREHAWPIG